MVLIELNEETNNMEENLEILSHKPINLILQFLTHNSEIDIQGV